MPLKEIFQKEPLYDPVHAHMLGVDERYTQRS